MDIKNANSHPFKVAIVSDDNEMYANSHPFQVKVVEGGSEMVTELPETGSKGTMYVLVDDVENPTKAYGIYVYDNGWVLIAQPVDQSVVKVDELPEVGEEGVLYYVPKTGTDTYDLYRWIDDSWIKVDTDIQLYSTTGENTDGAMTQKAVTDALGDKQDTLTAGEGINISTQDVISATNTGKAKMLTTADYNANSSNWSDTDPTHFNCVALWELAPGMYAKSSSDVVALYSKNTTHSMGNATIAIVGKQGSFGKPIILLSANNTTQEGWTCGSVAYVQNGLLSAYKGYSLGAEVQDNLTSTYGGAPLSAKQGKVLNERIGDLTTLTTTAKTSAVAAINELDFAVDGKQDALTAGEAINISAQNVISATNTGLAKELTTADYNANSSNWTDTDPANFNCVALWKLADGLYYVGSGVTAYIDRGTTAEAGRVALIDSTSRSGYSQIALFGHNNQAILFYRMNNSGNPSAGSPIQNLTSSTIVDDLNSTLNIWPLSANQGKVLADRIGDLTALNTTDKTSAVAAINEVLANAGKPIELTTADYNYPTNNPTGIALWMLDAGDYHINTSDDNTLRFYRYNGDSGVDLRQGNITIAKSRSGGGSVFTYALYGDSGRYKLVISQNGSSSGAKTGSVLASDDVQDNLTSTSTNTPLSANQGRVLNDKIEGRIVQNAGAPTTSTVGTVGLLLEDTTNGNVYLCTAIDTTTDPQNPAYTWEKLAKDSDLPVTLTNAQYEALWSTSNALNDYLETIISGEGV